LIQDKDFASKLSKNCQNLARKEYGIEVLVKQTEEILYKLETS